MVIFISTGVIKMVLSVPEHFLAYMLYNTDLTFKVWWYCLFSLPD